jgi:hypothetical protein
MKLLTKITLWNIGIITVVMIVTMFIARNNLALENKQAEVERLLDKNDGIAQQIQEKGLASVQLNGEPVSITKWNGPVPSSKKSVEESSTLNKHLGRNEHRITVSSFVQSGSEVYKISSYNYITLVWGSILQSLAMKLLPIILCIIIAAALISRYTISPFRKTMEALRSFNITQKKQLQLTASTTKEFRNSTSFCGI